MITMNHFYVSVLSKLCNYIIMSNNNEIPPAWESVLGLSWIILDEE
jgi:hypothetical protein